MCVRVHAITVKRSDLRPRYSAWMVARLDRTYVNFIGEGHRCSSRLGLGSGYDARDGRMLCGSWRLVTNEIKCKWSVRPRVRILVVTDHPRTGDVYGPWPRIVRSYSRVCKAIFTTLEHGSCSRAVNR